MTLFLLSLLIFLPRILLGAGLAHFLWRDSRPAAWALKLLTGIPLGLGLCSSAMLFALKAGIAPSAYAPLEAGISLAGSGFFLVSLYRLRPRLPALSRENLLLGALILLGLALGAGAFLAYSFRHPHGFGDAWTIWNNLPRYLYRSDDPGLLFRPQEYARLHPDYPALTSLSLTSVWALLKNDTTRAPMALAFLLTLASPAALGLALTLTKEKSLGVFAALTALMTLQLAMTVGQGADAALALTFLLAGVFLFLYAQNPAPGLLILAGLLAGFSAWVKNEGLLFALLMLLPAAWLARRRLLFFAAGLIFPLLVVFFFKMTVAAQSDLARPLAETLARLLDFSRYGLIAASYLREIWNFGGWPLSQALVLAAFAAWRKVSPGGWRAAAPLWALILLQQSGYFFIYVITPHDLQLHLDTSLARLLYQTYPLTLFAFFLSLSDQPLFGENPTSPPEDGATRHIRKLPFARFLLLIALTLGLNGLLFPLSPTPAEDYVSAWEVKMEAVKRRLPAGVKIIGYFSEADILPGPPAPDDYIEYYLTQYSLVPRLVQRGAAAQWILVNSAAPGTAAWLKNQLPACRAEKIGGGLTLLECLP